MLSPSVSEEMPFLNRYRKKFQNGIGLLKKKVIFSRGHVTSRCDVSMAYSPVRRMATVLRCPDQPAP